MRHTPFNIHEHGRRLVRRAITVPGELSDSIMHLAMGTKREWTINEIEALNAELENCNLTIGQWLERKGEV